VKQKMRVSALPLASRNWRYLSSAGVWCRRTSRCPCATP
jgi:hypothetical protein